MAQQRLKMYAQLVPHDQLDQELEDHRYLFRVQDEFSFTRDRDGSGLWATAYLDHHKRPRTKPVDTQPFAFHKVYERVEWKNTSPSPLISLTTSLFWALWEALCRYHKLGERYTAYDNLTISVIDTHSLPREDVRYAETILQKIPSGAGYERAEALCRFSQHAHEVLVHRHIPSNDILSTVPLDDEGLVSAIQALYPGFHLEKDEKIEDKSYRGVRNGTLYNAWIRAREEHGVQGIARLVTKLIVALLLDLWQEARHRSSQGETDPWREAEEHTRNLAKQTLSDMYVVHPEHRRAINQGIDEELAAVRRTHSEVDTGLDALVQGMNNLGLQAVKEHPAAAAAVPA